MASVRRGAVVLGFLSSVVLLFYRGLVVDRLVIGDFDAFVYFYPLREYAASVLRQGSIPLWNPYLFMGAPFLANIQTAVLYPANWVFALLPAPYAFSASIVGHVLLAGAAMYMFGRRVLTIAPVAAGLSAVAFMFSGFMTAQVGHINQLNVSAWLPLLLVVFHESVRFRSLRLVVATGVAGAMQFLAGHTQEWYFSTVSLGVLALWLALTPGHSSVPSSDQPLVRRGRPFLHLALVGLIEAGLGAVQLLPSLELSRESIRAGGMHYGEVVSFSLPPFTALYSLLPTYPAELFSEYVGYIGVVPLVLAALALAWWAVRPVTLLAAGLAILGIFMALGGYNPLYPLLVKLVPGLDLFRVPARWLLVYTLGASALAGLGAQLILDLHRRDFWTLGKRFGWRVARLPRVVVATAVVGAGLALLALLGAIARPRPGGAEVLAWVGLASVTLVLAYLTSRSALLSAPIAATLLVLTVAELWVAGGNAVFRSPIPAQAYMPQRTSTDFILTEAARAEGPERVLSIATDHYEVKETPDYKKDYAWLSTKSLTQFLVAIKLSETLSPNLPMEYRLETPDGYDGGILPLERYARFKNQLLPSGKAAPDSILRYNLPHAPRASVLNLMNVRYLLASKIMDARVDNVYYDMAVPIALQPERSYAVTRLPRLAATSIGIISNTEGARSLPNGQTVAVLRATDQSGRSYELPLRVGVETAETVAGDDTLGKPAHSRPREVPPWEPASKDSNSFAKLKLPDRLQLERLELANVADQARVNIRAITLIDDVAAVSEPLVLSDNLDRTMFFDMKVYTNRSALPRAFMAYSSAVRDDQLALAAIRDPETDFANLVLLAPSPAARTVFRSGLGGLSEGDARFTSYRPEEIAVEMSARQDGYLVLLDTYYPGWTAEVDGREVPIERADYLFRAVRVDSGAHTVVFRYAPASFALGSAVTLSTAVLLIGVLAWRAVARRAARRVI